MDAEKQIEVWFNAGRRPSMDVLIKFCRHQAFRSQPEEKCDPENVTFELDAPEPEPIPEAVPPPFPQIPQNVMNFNFYPPYPMYPNVSPMYPNVFPNIYFPQ